MPVHYEPLDRNAMRVLARALGDTPQTVISVHLLDRGACRAYVAGEPDRLQAAVIQDDNVPEEPVAFGSDAPAIWDVLQSVDGWACVDVSTQSARSLGDIIQRERGRPVRYYGDVYHALSQPAAALPNPSVRRLTLNDLHLFGPAPPELRINGFGGMPRLLEGGFAAGAVVDGRLVAMAHTYAVSERHAEIGVFTTAEWRRRGFATAAAAIVAKCTQETGRTPVWSAGETNAASLRVAAKVGFREVSRRTYVIPAER